MNGRTLAASLQREVGRVAPARYRCRLPARNSAWTCEIDTGKDHDGAIYWLNVDSKRCWRGMLGLVKGDAWEHAPPKPRRCLRQRAGLRKRSGWTRSALSVIASIV